MSKVAAGRDGRDRHALLDDLALAVPVPFVSPDGQAVVPLPAVFISGTGKLLAL